MATYQSGILGSFSGKVGPVVGSQWRGKSILRSLPSPSTKAPSVAQQRQREKFAFVLAFLNPLKALLMASFGDQVGHKSAFDRALSYHLKEALTATATGFEMRYSKVLIGWGGLCGLAHPVVTPTQPNSLTLTWDDNSNQGFAYPEDSLVVVAYAPALRDFAFFIACSHRELSQCNLEFPERFQQQTVHLWATFSNTDRHLSATSHYLGAMVL